MRGRRASISRSRASIRTAVGWRRSAGSPTTIIWCGSVTIIAGAVEFGRGTVISLRGPFPFARGAGALRAPLLGIVARGEAIGASPRVMPGVEGRGADCGRICGAAERALMSGRAPLIGARAVPMPPALGGRGTERDPKPPGPFGARIALPGFGDAPRCGIRATFEGVRTPF